MADILVLRNKPSDKSTIGKFKFGKKTFYSLEDIDRGLTSDMSIEEIKKLKIYGKTAIPSGRYEMGITYSNRFKKLMPEILDVPGFAGIRVHAGNYPEDSNGCPLIGLKTGTDAIYQSRDAYKEFWEWFQETIKNEKVFIEIRSFS